MSIEFCVKCVHTGLVAEAFGLFDRRVAACVSGTDANGKQSAAENTKLSQSVHLQPAYCTIKLPSISPRNDPTSPEMDIIEAYGASSVTIHEE
jgi:hypothetical protein